MDIVSQVKIPFSAKKEKLLFKLPIRQRLTLGFLLSPQALIAGFVTGGTALTGIQSLHQESDFYQQLLQTKTNLESGKSLLELMDIQMHEILASVNNPVSLETLQDDENNLRSLIDDNDRILRNYTSQDLLKNSPSHLSLFSPTYENTLVTTQEALANSVMRTWKFFQKVQLGILSQIGPPNNNTQNIANSINQEHLQGEPLFSDALSAMVALIHFSENLSQSAGNVVSHEEMNQIRITFFGVVFALISIALIGLLISNTMVSRLRQLRQVTKAIEQGEVQERIRVKGNDEIADISASVNAMLEIIASGQEIIIASERKDQFIASMSHELRNPLTNIFGWLEILIDYHKELDEETRTRFLSSAMYGCRELMEIIKSVLDATRIERGMGIAQLERVPLNPIVEAVLSNMDPRKTEKYHIETVMEEEFVALADPQHVHQILENLLTNAFKYLPKRSTVTTSISRLSHQAPDTCSPQTNDLCICVKDTGPGIPPQIPNLFQKFARLQRDSATHGTGLGLYLCKQLVESMGGNIWVESTGIAGEGCSFFFTLPEASPVANIYD